MNNKDLQTGMVVELRGGCRYIIIGNNLMSIDSYLSIGKVNKDLTIHSFENSNNLDIVEVYVAQEDFTLNNLNDGKNLKVIWERKEEKELVTVKDLLAIERQESIKMETIKNYKEQIEIKKVEYKNKLCKKLYNSFCSDLEKQLWKIENDGKITDDRKQKIDTLFYNYKVFSNIPENLKKCKIEYTIEAKNARNGRVIFPARELLASGSISFENFYKVLERNIIYDEDQNFYYTFKKLY